MDWKKTLLTSPEVWTGTGLFTAGIFALAHGEHGILAQALAPFGIGLVLSEVLAKGAHAAHERVKVRVRRDDDQNRD